MLKLTLLKMNWSARRVLNIFIIWTSVWLIMLFWKIEFLSSHNKKFDYRIRTAGCRIKDFKKIPKFMFWLNTPNISVPNCPMPQFEVTNRAVRLEYTHDVSNCTLTPFKRITDEQIIFDLSHETPLQQFYTIKSKADFFQLDCFRNSSETRELRDYGLLTPTADSKPDIKSFQTSKQTFSVLLLGFNKVTYADADLQLKHTMEFLRKQADFLEFRGFNGLGPKASWNMLAILTGRKDYRLSDNPTYLDKLDFVWKAYSANKFFTVFGENTYKKSLFNGPNVSFDRQPTDYYLRPFLVKIANDDAFKPKPATVTLNAATEHGVFDPYSKYKVSSIVEKCKGSRHEQHIVLELMNQFLPFYLERLTFSFYWFSRIAPFLPHDDMAIAALLKKYKEAGVFNRTFVFVVSNVNRLPLRGEKWLKQPLLFASVPADFKSYYPEAYEHFKANAEKLTTPYDLHATLLQLANFTANASNLRKILVEGRLRPYLYGTNLFNETISSSRTCREANIPKESCICL